MLTDNEAKFTNAFGLEYEDDPHCENPECDRSIVTRFGGIPPVECDSCSAEFDKLMEAGKIWFE